MFDMKIRFHYTAPIHAGVTNNNMIKKYMIFMGDLYIYI
jgi:hypothetical protein